MEMEISEIVRQHVIKHQGRMPETQQEIDEYLDLINHLKSYADAFEMEKVVGKQAMKTWGFKTTDDIKKEGQEIFKSPPLRSRRDRKRKI